MNIQSLNVNLNINICFITVTSSFQKEGKLATITNLALIFAQQAKRFFFVDVDLRKTIVQYTFQLKNYIGLMNVLKK